MTKRFIITLLLTATVFFQQPAEAFDWLSAGKDFPASPPKSQPVNESTLPPWLFDAPKDEAVIEENPIQAMIRQMCENILHLYNQNLHAMVDEGWHAPKPPHKGTWVAKLKYDLMRGGKVTNIRVVQPSGHPPIDESAKNRVHEIEFQFKPFPSCYTKDSMEIDHVFKVIYR